MTQLVRRRSALSRRSFLQVAGAGTPAACGLVPRRARAQPKTTLKIAQWAHFLPEYDQWFAEVYAKEWGRKHDTNVIVDRIAIDQIHTRAAAEVAAGTGHDLFMFPAPPAVYQRHAIDHGEIYQEVSRRHGNVNSLGHRSTFDPKTKRYFAFADSWIPAPLPYFQDYWSEINVPLGPSTYDALRDGAKKIRAKLGVPCGLSLAPNLEGNITLQTILWAFRVSVQDAEGNVTINANRMVIWALEFVKALYEEAGTPEALTWKPSANARAMLARKTSCTINAISLLRTAETENPDLARHIMFRPPMRGPAGVVAAPHVTSCSAVWSFAENKDGAKQFLVDLIGNFGTVFQKSRGCNFPMFQSTVPDLINRLLNDPAVPPLKYGPLRDALFWCQNLGYPGYATPAAMEVFDSFVIPKMFASVIKGDLSPDDAARAAEAESKRIFAKWRQA
jgi:multiple sugar transport system substrate-binding protein